jgi:Protein of unknown function (DUF3309)
MSRSHLVRAHGTKQKWRAYLRPRLYLDTNLSIGSIARVKTKIHATITAHVNATAPDGTTTARKSRTASITLTDKATAKSSHSGQFLDTDNSSAANPGVAGFIGNTSLSFVAQFNNQKWTISALRSSEFSHVIYGTSVTDVRCVIGLDTAEDNAMLGTVLIIILILLLIGALPTWGYSSGWGYYPGGGLGIILIIVIILVLMGRI